MNSLICFALDQSSSMDGPKTVTAFNTFLTMMQYRIDDCALYLATFDDVYTPQIEFQSIFEVPMMSTDRNTLYGERKPFTTTLHYTPRGSTLLYDGTAIMVQKVQDYINKLPEVERPTNVTLVVQTDGGNNGGHMSYHDVRRIVEGAIKSNGWHVLFLGDQGPYGTGDGMRNVAANMGFPRESILLYQDAEQGFGEAANTILESVVTGSIGRKEIVG